VNRDDEIAAESSFDRHLARSDVCAYQRQVCNIRASDQEQERDRAEQQVQRRTDVANHRLPERLHGPRRSCARCTGPVASVRGYGDGERGIGLFHADTAPQTAGHRKQLPRVKAPRIHLKRQPHGGRRAELRRLELRTQYAHDIVRQVPERYPLTKRCGRTVK